MPRFIVAFAVLGLFLHSPATAQQSALKTSNRNARLESATKELANSIRDAKLLLVGVTNRDLRKRLETLLSQAEGNVAVIQADLFTLNGKRQPVLDKKAFEDLLAAVKKRSFDSKKRDYLLDYMKLRGDRGPRLSSAQVKKLLAAFQFDKDRETVAVALFEVTADRENFLQVLDAFTFSSGRDKVRKALGLRK